MKNTGLLADVIPESARKIVFGETVDRELDANLRMMVRVDKAHLVMLARQNLIDQVHAARLLLAIEDLARNDGAPLRGLAAPRGLYILYESWLGRVIGDQVAGELQLARSRNDLNATIFALTLMEDIIGLLKALTETRTQLIRSAEIHIDVACPTFTHHRPGMPSTWSFMLTAVGRAFEKDATVLLKVLEEAQSECPLGAGAGAGTELPIDCSLTARLLGFRHGPKHALYCVASRDTGLRAAAAAAMIAVTSARFANTLLSLVGDLEAARLPDHLVGGSSAMPQKRNPYLAEHIVAMAADVTGALGASLANSLSTPFTNAIGVGTYATVQIKSCMEKTRDALSLLSLLVAGAEPNADRLDQIAKQGAVWATQAAWRIRSDSDVSFRQAHHEVGAWLRGSTSSESKQSHLSTIEAIANLDQLGLANALTHGGGPAHGAVCKQLTDLKRASTIQDRRLFRIAEQLDRSERLLRDEVGKLTQSAGVTDDRSAR